MTDDTPDATVHILKTPTSPVQECDGSYICECSDCRADVARRVTIGIRATRHPVKLAA